MQKLLILILLVFGFQTTFARTPSKPSRPSSSTPSSAAMNSWSSEEEYEAQSSLSNGYYQTTKVGNTNVSVLDASVSLAKLIKNNIQAGAEVHFRNASGISSGSYFEVVGFGVYNLTSLIKDTFYVKGGAGMYNTINDRGDNESKFGFFVGGGKRIPLWSQITYSPEARLHKIGSQDFTFSIYFINLSLFF